MMYLGIDWGKSVHHARLLDSSKQSLLHTSFPHTPAGFEDFMSALLKAAPNPGEVAVAVETKHGILIEFLVAQGFQVYPVNPKSADRFREALSAGGKKSDEIDAEVLALYLFNFWGKVPRLFPDSETVQRLRRCVEFRQTLVADKVALENRLQDILGSYFPAAQTAFDDFSAAWVMDFLAQFPTPNRAKLSEKRLNGWFDKRHPQVSPETREKILNAFNAPALQTTDAMTEVESQKMRFTLDSLRLVVKNIGEVEKTIRDLFRQHDDAGTFSSLPGAAETLAPWLLCMFGDNRDRFPRPECAAQLAGTAPVSRQSGKSRWEHMRWACSKSFRQAMRLFSDASWKCRECWAHAYYKHKRQEGDAHETTLRKLANRWIRIIWRLWQDRSTYCEAVHVENRSKTGRNTLDLATAP
jgi:transposase